LSAGASSLEQAAAYGKPDPMIVKAIIYVECRFQYDATGCPNLPCGIPSGRTEPECYCFGLMQVVPACGGTDGLGLLSNGHPNMSTSPGSAYWDNSIYNPQVNIEIDIAGIAGNRDQVEEQFPGCTEDQYTLMATGNYDSYGSTQSCTEINQQYVDHVLEVYQEYSTAAGWTPHPY
jgi:hypothetical protein